jgi:putative membrane protein
MSSGSRISHKWLPAAVFGAWTLSLAYLLASRDYTDFLRPEFGLLLAPAHFIAMGFALAAMTAANAPPITFERAFRALALLVPLLYLALPVHTILGESAFKSRFIGVGPMSAEATLPRPDVAADPAFQPPEGVPPAVAPGPPRERTILEIFRNPQRYRNQRVVFTGMILRDEKLKPFFGGRDTAVYRFLITCCAADAMPLAIALDSPQAADLANDQWVRVEGIFHLDQIAGRPVPRVEAAILTPVEASGLPYLF